MESRQRLRINPKTVQNTQLKTHKEQRNIVIPEEAKSPAPQGSGWPKEKWRSCFTSTASNSISTAEWVSYGTGILDFLRGGRGSEMPTRPYNASQPGYSVLT
jgi:hypothetical protein